MRKQTIGVDIDDVLAVHAEAMVAYSNKTFGTNLTVDDYNEHWSQMWQVDLAETERRAAEYHRTHDIANYKHNVDAGAVLRRLAERYRLIIVTARRREVSKITEDWIQKYYAGLFESIHFAGIWDKIDERSSQATKAELCKQLAVDYLIDDQSKHCNGAAAIGIPAIMFGDYPWSRNDEVHSGVTRCKDWSAVEKYFDARR